MDIWDSLRLTLRHWKFTLPMLAGGVALAVVLSSSTATTWKVESTVVLVGPAEATTVIDGVPTKVQQNSYFRAGVAMPLTRVLTYAFRDPSKLGRLASEGLSTDFTMTWDNRQPLITTKLVAESSDLAAASVARLLVLLAEDLAARQEAVEAPPTERASVEVLAVSDPSEDFRNPRLVLALLLMVTLALAVLTAFLLESRRRPPEPSAGAGTPPEKPLSGERNTSGRPEPLHDAANPQQLNLPPRVADSRDLTRAPQHRGSR